MSKTLDPFHQHEAMDRTYIQLEQLESALGEHPVIKGDSAAKELYEKAINSLSDLYQYLGSNEAKEV
ncbi:hypothetical protein ACOLZ1_002903 [Vibrio fluvialis]|uniref:hypothetical protein n=1 Tax=Vibrio sp. bablab_jr001 TaxID=2755067 RepID=UPI0018F1D7E2|nr:hypothetical protein [Vibrio sp. bablab_jr001]